MTSLAMISAESGRAATVPQNLAHSSSGEPKLFSTPSVMQNTALGSSVPAAWRNSFTASVSHSEVVWFKKHLGSSGTGMENDVPSIESAKPPSPICRRS